MKETPEGNPDGGSGFDDFPEGHGVRTERALHDGTVAKVLRALSGAALVFAFGTAAGVILVDALHWLRPEVTWRVKSALPLIGIGVSYAFLQFTLPRTKREFLLSMAVSLAFILWGVEQFIPVARIASLVDDVVVFLFVLDLGIVIRGRLRSDT
jgi:hypothetical protein